MVISLLLSLFHSLCYLLLAPLAMGFFRLICETKSVLLSSSSYGSLNSLACLIVSILTFISSSAMVTRVHFQSNLVLSGYGKSCSFLIEFVLSGYGKSSSFTKVICFVLSLLFLVTLGLFSSSSWSCRVR